jgi:hypothetical protein
MRARDFFRQIATLSPAGCSQITASTCADATASPAKPELGVIAPALPFGVTILG